MSRSADRSADADLFGTDRALLLSRPAPRSVLVADAVPAHGTLPGRGSPPSHGRARQQPVRYDLVVGPAPIEARLGGSLTWGGLTLRALVDLVCDGGELYLEVDRPGLRVPPRRILAALAAMGLHDVRMYWLRPTLRRPALLVPLTDRRTQRHYVRQLLWRTTILRRAATAALEMAIAARAFGVTARRYVVVARKDAEPSAGQSLPWPLTGLRDGWAELATTRSRPSRLTWIVRTNPASPSGTRVAPVWVDHDGGPSLVLKVAGNPHGNERLAAEHRALAAAGRAAPDGSVRVPRALGSLVIHGRRVNVQEHVAGRPLDMVLAERPGAAIASRAAHDIAGWLIAMHRAPARPATASDLDRLLFGPLARAADDLGLDESDRMTLERLVSRAQSLATAHRLPITFNHNDLGPPNILCGRAGDATGVVDWESAAEGLPGLDLLYLLARLAAARLPDTVPDDLLGFRAAFLAGDAGAAGAADRPHRQVARDTRRLIAAYMRALGIDRGWLPILLTACWVLHAGNEARQQAGRSAGPSSTRPTQSSRAHLQVALRHLRTVPSTGAAAAGALRQTG